MYICTYNITLLLVYVDIAELVHPTTCRWVGNILVRVQINSTRSFTLRVKDHSDMLSAQYLVNCLEEDQSWHHNSRSKSKIHKGDSPLQTSLNCSSQTWLKQDGKPPESAHTCGIFSYSTPRKQQSTKEASTPNIGRGEETHRRQRYTLSQLRSGHYHLLQDYKHRMLGGNQATYAQTVELYHKM